MSLCPSIQLHGTLLPMDDFQEILYLSIFRKFVEKVQVPLGSDKNSSRLNLHEDLCMFMIISHSLLLIMVIFLTKVIEKIKTHYFKIAFNHTQKNVIRFFNVCYMCQLCSLSRGISINMQHILTRIIRFIVADGSMYVN